MRTISFASRFVTLALMLTACTSVEVQGTGGATSSSSSSASSSSGVGGMGGAGGGCSVALPAGCGCPDGAAGPWVKQFTMPGANYGTGVGWQNHWGAAPDGSILVSTATYEDPDPASPGVTMFVASSLVKLDATGKVVWEVSDDDVHAPTPDRSDCTTIFTGLLHEPTEILGKPVSCSSAYCAYVGRFDAAGAVVDLKVFDYGGSGRLFPEIAGVLPDGRVALVGAFEDTIDLGTGPVTVPPWPSSGIFAALLSPAFETLWTRSFVIENTALEGAAGVVSPAGDITVAAQPKGAVDFGEGFVPQPGAPHDPGLAIASWDSSGAKRYGKLLGYPQKYLAFPSLALGADGHVVVAQRVGGTMDFGCGPIAMDPSAGHTGVAALDAGGQCVWSTGLELSDDTAVQLAVAPSGHLWVAAGSGSLAELDPQGVLLANHPLGGTGARRVAALAFAPDGAPVIGGTFDETLDLGTGPITAQSIHDGFVAKLAP